MSHSKFVVGAVCTATVVLLLLITQKDKQRQEGKETPTCRQSSSLLQAATTRRRSDTSQTGTICSMCWQVSLQLSSHLRPCEASRQSLVVVSAGQLGSPRPPLPLLLCPRPASCPGRPLWPDCSLRWGRHYQPQFILIFTSGEKLSTPRKLVSMMMFSFEVIMRNMTNPHIQRHHCLGGHSGDCSPRAPRRCGLCLPGRGHEVT